MSKKPNILFVFSDQQRFDTMGCYGQQLPITPNLDAMAASGVQFNNAFTCQPVCGPARACLQTGKYATQVGCWRNGLALPTTEQTMAHFLGGAGYETAYIGKWHLASNGPEQDFATQPVPPQFRGGYKDFWMASDVLEFTSHSYDGHVFDGAGNRREFAQGKYRVDAMTDFALEFLRGRNKSQPFYAFISYIEPHFQNDHNRYEGPHGSADRFKDYIVPSDLVGTGGDWKESYPDYLGCCWSIDQNFARLREELVHQGEWENTVVIYTSDHGCHFRTRNPEYKRSCHESSIHIPLIVQGPGFTGGVVKEELVSLLDLAPSVLQAAGIQPPDSMVGRPLQDLVSGNARDWRDALYIQISEDHIGRSIRTRKWKYEVWAPSENPWSGSNESGSDVYTERYLYDLENDPFEQQNLVADPKLKVVRQGLAARLKTMMENAGESAPSVLPAKL